MAYHGHWISLKHDREVEEIQRIEQEEWHHRRRLGMMLTELDARPRRGLDAFQALVGAIILIGCNMVGWFIPMYFVLRRASGIPERPGI